MMRFEWNEIKDEDNRRNRGFGFAFATLIFDGPVVERSDVRFPYGERRVVAVGCADAGYITVVYTDRLDEFGPVRRIISARPSNRREHLLYGKTQT